MNKKCVVIFVLISFIAMSFLITATGCGTNKSILDKKASSESGRNVDEKSSSKRTPEAAPQITPKSVPVSTSTVTPKSTPKSTPKASPDTTPKSTPVSTPKSTGTTAAGNGKTIATGDNSGSSEPASGNANQTINSKNITVEKNSLEYDLQATLYENNKKRTFLMFEYYLSGSSVIKEFNEQQIPEIKGIFERTGAGKEGSAGNRIKTLYLIAKKAKAYIMIEGPVDSKNEVETAIYSFHLKNSLLKKVFNAKGIYTKLFFTPDRGYMAFSYSNAAVPPNAFLQVVECSTDELLLNKNKTTSGHIMGNPKNTGLSYNYTMLSWFTNSIAKVKEVVRSGVSDIASMQREILYDLKKNDFSNLDGSGITGNAGASGQQNSNESEPVKTLRNFYLCLVTGKYDTAYDTLDSKFRLGAFKDLGVTEMDKADIDVEKFSQYGIFFQAARIKSIVKEIVEENAATIYYYQLLALERGDQVQPLVVLMKKTDAGWKIVSVDDGNANEAPFK